MKFQYCRKLFKAFSINNSLTKNKLISRILNKYLVLIFFLFSLNTFAQFPAPADFQFSYFYITCNETGFCEGQVVGGPTYCSSFSWNVPDTAGITTQLEFYRIYYRQYFVQDSTIIIIAEVNETFQEMQIGILGEIWVTAVYSNPDGESEPSNIFINDDLPISIKEQNNTDQIHFYYDRDSGNLSFPGDGTLNTIKVYDLHGRCIISTSYYKQSISLNALSEGIYIIEGISSEGKTFRQKVFIY
jgi:hypothetical protein